MAIAVPASSAITKVLATKAGPKTRAAITVMTISAAVSTPAVSTTVAVLNVLDIREGARHEVEAKRCC